MSLDGILTQFFTVRNFRVADLLQTRNRRALPLRERWASRKLQKQR